MSEFVRKKFTIINAKGLHARAASKLVKVASGFACEITLSGPEEEAISAKSVMGVLLLCGVPGATLVVRALGPDAQEAVDAIGALIQNRFGEES